VVNAFLKPGALPGSYWTVEEKCLAFQVNNHAVEPGLFEPQSLLPGNGISRAETERPKRLRTLKDALAETKTH
jgi:hypothetical protein